MIISKQNFLPLDEANSFIKDRLPYLLELLGLEHWDIEIKIYYDREEQGAGGTVELLPEYDKAIIHLYLPNFSDTDDLEKTLKHELMHCVHAPFQKAQNLIEKLFESGDRGLSILTEAFRQASEETVLNINRMHRGHLEAKGK